MNVLIKSLLQGLSPALALPPDDDVDQPVDDPLRVQSKMQAEETIDRLTRVVLASTAAHMEHVKLVKACADRDEMRARLAQLGVQSKLPACFGRFLSLGAAPRHVLSADAASQSLEAWRVAASCPAEDLADAALDLCDRGATFVSTSF